VGDEHTLLLPILETGGRERICRGPHSSVSSRILPWFGPVLPLLVLANILLIWFHHPALSMWLIILTAAIHLLMAVIRFQVFVPIHRKLDKAKSMELINRLLRYDIYLEGRTSLSDGSPVSSFVCNL